MSELKSWFVPFIEPLQVFALRKGTNMEGMNFTLIQKLHEHGEFDIHIMVAIIVKD